jgi:hypothetical protein
VRITTEEDRMIKRRVIIVVTALAAVFGTVGVGEAFASKSGHGVGPSPSVYWAVGPSDTGSTGLSRVCDAHITNYGYSYGRCNSV